MKHRSKIPSREEVERILATVDKENPDDYPIYWLMGRRGLRIGEIVSDTREGDKYFEGKWGSAWKHWKSNLPGLQIEDLTESGIMVKGKKGHDDFVPLPADIVAKLRDIHGDRTKGPIFQDVASHKDPVGTMDHRTKQYCRQAGIENWKYVHPHAFRHAFGYRSARAVAGDVYKVRDLMRHKGTGPSSRYVHEMDETELRDVLNKLDH